MNESLYIPVIVALIAGPITVWITTRLSKRRVEADTTQTLTDIALSLVDPLKKRISELEVHARQQDAAIAALKERNEALERWAALLWTRSVESGITPPTLDESERLFAKGLHPSNHRS